MSNIGMYEKISDLKQEKQNVYTNYIGKIVFSYVCALF